jgi:cell division protein FtsZ
VAVEPSGVTAAPVATPEAAPAEPEPAADGGSSWPAAPAAAGSDIEDEAYDQAADPVPAATAAVPARQRADPGAAARMFDAATTRRRSVVFEEDDELDVPDFLK